MPARKAQMQDEDTPIEEMKRTRGGFIPSGTSARRREAHVKSGTPRGQRTRRHLIASAREVFEANGYMDATVAQIAAQAKVAHGTFYTYFTSKQEIFRAVYMTVENEIRAAVAPAADDVKGDTIANLDRANRRWLETIRRNGRMIGLNEQVATIDSELHEARLELRQHHVDRLAKTIERWQQAGIAQADVDPTTAAGALVSMNSNFAYWLIVGGDEYDYETAVSTLTSLWVNALKIAPESRTKTIRQRRRDVAAATAGV